MPDDTFEMLSDSDDPLQCQRLGNDIWLMLSGENHAGAITPKLGTAFTRALAAISHSHQNNPARTLYIQLGSSAGADLDHPMESLHHINQLLEQLWQLHASGLRVQADIDESCHGGMAILLAACADDMLLGDTTTVSLLGPRILKAFFTGPLPTQLPGPDVAIPVPPRLRRVSMPA